MKKILLLALLSTSYCLSNAQTLTSGNVIVLRVGDSISTLSNTGNKLALDQFTTSGTYVNSVLLPKTGSNAVCLSGTATSEGQLTLAGNNSALILIAYKTAAPYSSSVNGTTSSSVNRTIVSINGSGTISLPTFTTTSFSANNPRFAFSNGTKYWAGGANTGIVTGSATSNLDTIVTTSSTNTRFLTNSGSQLYYSTASGTVGIWKLGTGAPTTSGNVSTPYIITTGSGTGTASPYGFSMKIDSTICYIADDRTIANGGGIQKWTRSGSTWTLAYTLGTGSTFGARSLAVNWNTTPPTIIATTAESNLNRVIRLNDTSSTVTAVTIATATTNNIFRGVAFTPGTSTLPVKFTSFNATINNKQTNLSWTTASEVNNKGFEIERSTDGVNFELIGFVKGNGNSNSVNKYNFVYPYQSSAFYRLKQIDFDGKFDYSNVISVQGNDLIIDITPNPFNNVIEINSNGNLVTAEVLDITGKVVITESINGNKTTLNTTGLNNGVYFVRINNGENMITKRLIKN